MSSENLPRRDGFVEGYPYLMRISYGDGRSQDVVLPIERAKWFDSDIHLTGEPIGAVVYRPTGRGCRAESYPIERNVKLKDLINSQKKYKPKIEEKPVVAVPAEPTSTSVSTSPTKPSSFLLPVYNRGEFIFGLRVKGHTQAKYAFNESQMEIVDPVLQMARHSIREVAETARREKVSFIARSPSQNNGLYYMFRVKPQPSGYRYSGDFDLPGFVKTYGLEALVSYLESTPEPKVV